VESCGLPDRRNKLSYYGSCKEIKINNAHCGQIQPKKFPKNLPKLETFAE
jgi:hypothetical protein